MGPIIVIGGTGFIIGSSVALSEYGYPSRTWPAYLSVSTPILKNQTPPESS